MKKNSRVYLGFDLGASSGRAVLGFLDRGKLRIEELHRFINGPVQLGSTLYWNFLALWSNIVDSLRICVEKGHTKLSGIGVDTWGVDFGLLGEDGRLVASPVHYRDARTEGIEKLIGRKIKNEEIYRLTGLGIGRIRTLSQLAAMRFGKERSKLECDKTFLMMPDLLRYFLCGDKSCELTDIGSSQLADVERSTWCGKIFKTFDLPRSIFPRIVQPGTVVGKLLPAIQQQTGLGPVPVVATAGHDTASAASAVPFAEPDTAFLSCGTWSCVGFINDKPINTAKAMKLDFVNEFGIDSMLLVRNLSGLYLVESLRRAWMAKGEDVKYSDLTKSAAAAKPFDILINPDAPIFFVVDNPDEAVAAYLRKTKQKPTTNRGQIVRGILEGLAFNYRRAMADVQDLSGRRLRKFCIVGGGVHNTLLCQMSADAAGLDVSAGPVEATVMGNLATQALADGMLKNSAEIRTLVRNSTKIAEYRPRNTAEWDRNFSRYMDFVTKSGT